MDCGRPSPSKTAGRNDEADFVGFEVAKMAIIRKTVFAPDLLSPAEASQLGLLVSWWGYVEYQAAVIIRLACHKRMRREDQWLLLAGAPINVLCEILRTLAFEQQTPWVHDSALREDLRQVAQDLQYAALIRSEYVHAVYGFADNDYSRRVRHDFKPIGHRTEPGYERISADVLSARVDEAKALWQRAETLTKRMKSRVRPRKPVRGTRS